MTGDGENEDLIKWYGLITEVANLRVKNEKLRNAMQKIINTMPVVIKKQDKDSLMSAEEIIEVYRIAAEAIREEDNDGHH